jgi:hypothetical protein
MASRRYTVRKTQSRHHPWMIFDTVENRVRISGYDDKQQAQWAAGQLNANDTTPPKPPCDAVVWKHDHHERCQKSGVHEVAVQPRPLFGDPDEHRDPRTIHACGVHRNQLQKHTWSGINVLREDDDPRKWHRSTPNERVYLIDPEDKT